MKKEQISNEVMRDSIKELRDQYHKLFKASLTESSEYYHAMGIVAGLAKELNLYIAKLKPSI